MFFLWEKIGKIIVFLQKEKEENPGEDYYVFEGFWLKVI